MTRQRWWLGAAAIAVAACSDTTEPNVTPVAPAPAVQPDLTEVTNLMFAQIVGGGYHSCGRTLTGGKVYCWGYNGSGELGNGSLNNKKRPTAVTGSLTFKWLSAGPYHTCGIATDAKAYCWGSNGYGQLGDGTQTDRWKPTLVSGGLSWKQIEAGGTYGGHTCGLTTGGKIYCWGYNGYGEVGIGYTSYVETVPVETSNVGATYRQLTAGGYHSCAVSTTNAAYCWGYADYGQTGNGGTYYVPTKVTGGLAFRQVTAGNYHTCGTTTGNKAYCWGQGYRGALGNGTTTNRYAPRAVSGGVSFNRVFSSNYHTCGLTGTGKAYCWGSNDYGELGDGTRSQRLAPVAVKGTLLFAQLGSRGYHTCAVTRTTGIGYCWGDNEYGQGGDGTVASPHLTPTRVAPAL
jgi:alpha-tubulin suppressor-like RCC1 family protein